MSNITTYHSYYDGVHQEFKTFADKLNNINNKHTCSVDIIEQYED